jgi:molybdopterin converting factor subunit 1
VGKAETSTMINRVRVLFFASLRDKAGRTEVLLDLPEGVSVYDLRLVIAEKIPNLNNEIFRFVVAVNREYVGDGEIIPGCAEIAIFPPVSGGCDERLTLCKVQIESIDIDDLVKQISSPTCGAIGMFVGIVRAITERGGMHKTEYLTYDAYIPMAEMKMSQIAEEIRERWKNVEGIAIIQRIGKLTTGTQSVLIACSGTHRDSGVFEAARYGIDRLKEIVPVWKQETGPQGQEWIDGDYYPRPGE